MGTNVQTKAYSGTIILSIVASTFLFYAYSTGITGVTQKNGNGCNCHNPSPSASVTVTINGPDSVVVNDTVTYTVTISGGPLTRAGTNIAASGGILTPGADMQKIGDELTHTLPKTPAGGVVTFQFSYTAPLAEGTQTLYANGNSVNFNGQNTGDEWNFAQNKTIRIIREIVPVELSNFSASVEGNNVKLIWSTATEVNNFGFEVQRLTPAPSQREGSSEATLWGVWGAIGFIKGNGNSTERNEYIFEDKNLSAGKYLYRLKQVDFNGTYEIFNLKEEIELNHPQVFTLNQNYPNPFNPETKISFVIKQAGNVLLKIYNSAGEETAVLANEFKEAGSHSYNFNAADYSSGVYYYTLKYTGDGKASYTDVKKMILIK